MPLYHRPDLLPPLPTHAVLAHSLRQKPAEYRLEYETLPSARPGVYGVSARGVAAAVGVQILFAGVAGALLGVGLVKGFPPHSGFLCGFGFAYLIGAFATGNILWRRLRTWRFVEENPMPVLRGNQNSPVSSTPPMSTTHARGVRETPNRKRTEWEPRLGRTI